jgi:hypothetical protein
MTGEINMAFEFRVTNALHEMNKLGYTPHVFLKMKIEHGTVDAIKRLINSKEISDGFTKLWKLGKLNLSMENIIQEPAWVNLFTEDERKKAKKRLKKYGYNL